MAIPPPITTTATGISPNVSSAVPTTGASIIPSIDVINYVFIRGKWYSLPNTATAQQAIQKYSGNDQSIRTSKPAGVLIDETFLNLNINQWPDTVADAVGVTGDALINPPVNPIIGPATENEVAPLVEDSTPVVSSAPSPSGPPPDQPPKEPVDPWTNLDQGKLNLAKRYADAGMMGRASTAFKDAGGVWDRTTSQRLRTEEVSTPRYGGDFDWSTYGIKQRDFGDISAYAKEGKFGKIKDMVTKGGGAWDKGLHKKLAAEYQGKGGEEGKPVRTQVPTPQIYKTGSKDWKKQFQGTAEDIRGKFKSGTPERAAAKLWRQRRMKKAGVGTKNVDKDMRDRVSRRFNIMIGKND